MNYSDGIQGVPLANETVRCSFPGAHSSQANVLAEDLSNYLQDEIYDVELNRERTDSHSQDFGATLIVVLATPAVAALAGGLSKWLARRADAKLHLEHTDENGRRREVTVDGQLGYRADKLIRDFLNTTSNDTAVEDSGNQSED